MSHNRKELVRKLWAILPERLPDILTLLKPDGVVPAASAIKAEPVFVEATSPRAAMHTQPGQQSRSRVAVLPLRGVISNHEGMMSEMFGGASVDRFAGWFRAAVKDPSISAIIIDCDSPGGTVQGVQELADEIFQARGTKPIIAQVNALCASAAYWIASQADEVVVTPSGEVGSIGVFAAHEDISKAVEDAGVKVTLVSAGKYKTEGNPFEPLSVEAQQALQDKVDYHYNEFVNAVARGRNTTPDAVRGGFGQGRTVQSVDVVKTGMADSVASLDKTMMDMGAMPSKMPMMDQMHGFKSQQHAGQIKAAFPSAFNVGDRVKVLVPHADMAMGDLGTIKEVSPEIPYAVQMDGMDDLHKWYTDSELEPAAAGTESPFKVGDRVKIKSPHMDMQVGDLGTIKEVSPEIPYAVQMDGMSEVHKWYVDSELEPAGTEAEGKKLSLDIRRKRLAIL